ncbi:hypothetical protein BX666DRAFT_2015711 [Dichotomocladium elegans]|nr:hypothetical protein BX666DRAFT_2015711 [Dichotomocladium elegans]
MSGTFFSFFFYTVIARARFLRDHGGSAFYCHRTQKTAKLHEVLGPYLQSMVLVLEANSTANHQQVLDGMVRFEA